MSNLPTAPAAERNELRQAWSDLRNFMGVGAVMASTRAARELRHPAKLDPIAYIVRRRWSERRIAGPPGRSATPRSPHPDMRHWVKRHPVHVSLLVGNDSVSRRRPVHVDRSRRRIFNSPLSVLRHNLTVILILRHHLLDIIGVERRKNVGSATVLRPPGLCRRSLRPIACRDGKSYPGRGLWTIRNPAPDRQTPKVPSMWPRRTNLRNSRLGQPRP